MIKLDQWNISIEHMGKSRNVSTFLQELSIEKVASQISGKNRLLNKRHVIR